MTTYPAQNLSIDQLKKKIQQREARVGIIGLRLCRAASGLVVQRTEVQGRPASDIDKRKVDTIQLKVVRTFTVSLPRRSKRLKPMALRGYVRLFTTDCMDAIIICVPTPLEIIPRTRSQLHYQHHAFHCASFFGRTTGGAGDRDLPGHEPKKS